jgi:hypothetical protein
MGNKKFIIQKIQEFDKTNPEKRRRVDFQRFAPYISKRDIEANGGYSSLYYLATNKKPLKYDRINTKDLFIEYSRLQQSAGIFDKPLLEKDIEKNKPLYSSSTFKKRFNGFKNFFIRHKQWNDKNFRIPAVNFFGKAAEYSVIAELLFRGYNAQLISVDSGLDVIAFKNGNIYFLQVKHGEENKITKSSFENNKEANVFYVFVINPKNKKQRDFIILPFSIIEKLTGVKVNKKIPYKIIYKKDRIYLNKISKENDITKYLNNGGWRNFEYCKV